MQKALKITKNNSQRNYFRNNFVSEGMPGSLTRSTGFGKTGFGKTSAVRKWPWLILSDLSDSVSEATARLGAVWPPPSRGQEVVSFWVCICKPGRLGQKSNQLIWPKVL